MDITERTRHEITRDLRVTATGFARELVKTAVASLERAALSERDPEVAQLFDEVDALVERFRRSHAELGDARMRRRVAGLVGAAEPGVPEAARPFSYIGPYFGAYSDVEAFARGALGFCGRVHPSTDATGLGLDLHLERRFWTIERHGTLHAFRIDEGDESHQDDRDRTRVRRLLCARFGADAVTEAMPMYAGRYPSLREFIRSCLWEMAFPTWLMIHVSVGSIGYDWCLDGSIFTIAAGEGGMHVFVRRDPLSHWRYQISG